MRRDRPAAARARQAGAAVDVQEVLHVAGTCRGAIGVDRRAAARDRLVEHGAQSLVQLALLVCVKPGAAAQRVEPRPPQRLVGVDIAHAGDECPGP